MRRMSTHQLVLWILITLVVAINARAANTIQLENAKTGTSDWILTNHAANHEIEGYASLTSVNRGGQIQFFVRTTDPSFTIEFFRTGWYGGTGGRRMTSAVSVTSTSQPACSNDQVTGLIECAWTNPYTLQIPNNTQDPTDWASGVYLAKLTAQPSAKTSYMVFVVRDDARASDLLFQSSVNTYQAYNNWGGRSLYAYNSDFQARKVSFNRPYTDSQGAGQYLFSYEYPAVRFLEREGYDVTYATDVDVHENSQLLLSHKGELIFGHGEYWSWEIRANVIAARDKGVSLGFFAANTSYWQVRYEPSVAGSAADRTLVGYKDAALTQDPDFTGGDTALFHLVTTNWRSTPVNLPEDAFIGVFYANTLNPTDIVVSDASSWVFASTGLQNGSHLAGLLASEVDTVGNNSPAGLAVLANSPYFPTGSTTTRFANMTVYTAASGATVFAAGTIPWSWGLDAFNHTAPAVSAPAQQITRNVLARFIGNPATLSLSSVSMNPTSLTGGNSATGTVTLSGPAPAGGVTVGLTSDTTAAAQVPGSVAVAAGATSATFSVTTGTVSSVTNVTITGNFGVTRSAILTVNPKSNVTLSSLTLSPTSVTGGTAANGTVTLSGAAPTGGATVTLSSTNPAAAQVNTSVTVNAGALTAVFPVNTSIVGSAVTVTITASYNGGNQNATLTVSPSSAGVKFTPTSLTFATQSVGTASTAQSVTLSNTGTSALNISSISITGSGAKEFKTGVINCGTILAAAASCTIPVMFAPVDAGSFTASLTATDDAVGSPQTVSLAGTASGIALTSQGNQNSATITAGQTATFSLQLVPTAFTGNVAVSCSGAPAGASCTVSPASVGVSGSASVAVTVTVTTTARALGVPPTPRFLFIPLAAMALLTWLAIALSGRRLKPTFAVAILLAIGFVGCSGATGGSGPTSSGNGTPQGTSTLTVTATSGSIQSTMPLTLVVN